MAKVARKKFELKPRPQVTFAERVQKAYEDMTSNLGGGVRVIGSCMGVDENSRDFGKFASFCDLPLKNEFGLGMAGMCIADIIWRVARECNVGTDEVVAQAKVWLDAMDSVDEEEE